MNLKLIIGPNRTEITDFNTSDIQLNFSLKNIKNFGQRNSSFSKTITVYRTEATESIFKALFNVNSTNFNISKKIYGELTDGCDVLLKGYIQVEEVQPTDTEYRIILASNNLSLIDTLSDDFIKGNKDVSKDLTFTGNLYTEDYNPTTIRKYMSTNPSNNGLGLMYAFIDHSETISTIENIVPNYLAIPCVAVKQIWDKILIDSSFSYEFSDDISTALNYMYIPFNNMEASVNTFDYAKIRFGTGATDIAYGPTSLIDQTFYLQGHTRVGDGYEIMKKWAYAYEDELEYYIIPMSGTYDISMGILCHPTNSLFTSNGPNTYSIVIIRDNEIKYEPVIGETDLAFPAQYIEKNITNLALLAGDLLYFRCKPNENGVATAETKYDTSTFIKLTYKNSVFNESIELYTENYTSNIIYHLNNSLPFNYKKSDFVNDIFLLFNVFISVDKYDENKIYIKTYDEFYTDAEVKDWSNKIISDSIRFKSLKNLQPLQYNFKYTDSDDLYNKDFKNQFDETFGTQKIINDSDFVKDTKDITLSIPSTIIKDIGSLGSYNNIYNFKIPVITSGNQLSTTWKPRILFSNTIDVSIEYGADIETAVNPWTTKFNTLSNQNTNVNATSLNLLFNAEKTYTSETTLSNNTLYNKYYKTDIENMLDDNAYFVTCKAFLRSSDIADFNFSDTIYINDKDAGASNYKVNAINNYNPETGLCDLELIKINYVEISYDTTLIPTKIIRQILTTGETTGTSSGSSSSGGGGTGQTVDLTSFATNPSVGLAFLSNVSLGLVFNKYTNASLGLVFNKYTNASLGLAFDKYTNASLGGNVRRTGDTMTGNLTINTSLFILGDASINNSIFVSNSIYLKDNGSLRIGGMDNTDTSARLRLHHSSDTGNAYVDYYENLYLRSGLTNSATTFICSSLGSLSSDSFTTGFAGSGWKINKDNNNFDLEIDNLKVRKQLSAYELEINKITSIGGTQVISVANGICTSVNGSILYFDTDNNQKPIQFVVNDYIRAQVYTGRGINAYSAKVTAIHDGSIDTDTTGGWAGMNLVQFGNSSNALRQNIILSTVADGSIQISGLTGVTNGTFVGHEKFRLGDLNGIVDASFETINGFGLYAKDNVYLNNANLKGTITANDGSIGGWNIASDAIYTGIKKLTTGYTTDGITISSNGTIRSKKFEIISDGKAKFEAVDSIFKSQTPEEGNLSGTLTYTQPNVVQVIHKDTIQLTGDSGNAFIGCDGIERTATFSSNLTITAANFATTPNTTDWAAIGITLTSAGTTLIFEGNTGEAYIDNNNPNLSGTVSHTEPVTAEKRKDTITIIGNSGQAAIEVNGIEGLVAWYDTSANTTTAFVDAFAESYEPIVNISSLGANIIFEANTAGVNFIGDSSVCHDINISRGSIKIEGNNIFEYDNSDESVIYINRKGYQGSTTQNRILSIGNGRGDWLAVFNNTTINFHRQIICLANIYAYDFILISDEKQKNNIKPILIDNIDVNYKQFEFKSKPNEIRYGVIAQELQKTNPELVKIDKKGNLGVSYTDLFIKEIAYLKNKIKELERRIK